MIYLNQSVPEVVEQVLRKHGFEGLDFEFRLSHEYPVRELITQWRETDLQFIQRLLAEVGIFWCFEMDTCLEQDVVIFQDNQADYQFGVTLPLRSPSGMSDGGQESLWDIRWVVDPAATQGMTINPAFLKAVNQLAAISDIVFAQGDAGVHFELLARPTHDVARMQLVLDEQKLDYFNQMEGWQSFVWPGNTYYPGVSLSWRNVNTGMRLYANYQGKWGFIRLLDNALVTPLDSSRTLLVWKAPDGRPLKFVMRSELGDGPLALLMLKGFRLPESIFSVGSSSESVQ